MAYLTHPIVFDLMYGTMRFQFIYTDWILLLLFTAAVFQAYFSIFHNCCDSGISSSQCGEYCVQVYWNEEKSIKYICTTIIKCIIMCVFIK